MKKIKDIYNESDDFTPTIFRLEFWLKEVLNKTEKELNELDVYTMLQHEMFEDSAIRKAIEFIKNNPLAGEMWDGQLLEQLSNVSEEKLKPYLEELTQLSEIIETKLDDLICSFDNYEKTQFLKIYKQFKRILVI